MSTSTRSIPEEFIALVVNEFGAEPNFQTVKSADLPPGELTAAVEYSSLNYKDALAVTSASKVLRNFPGIPGIDLAGTVVESSDPAFKIGDRVMSTGWGLGETKWGGYADFARINAKDALHIPNWLTPRNSMAIGTAGVTAMLCTQALKKFGGELNGAEALVTGATGGVGSFAVAILAKLGCSVTASSGKPEAAEYLTSLGAKTIIARSELLGMNKPLESPRWRFAIDSVGGDTLANVLAKMQPGGVVAAVGVAGGAELNTTVMPFILRSVALVGVSSVKNVNKPHAWIELEHALPKDAISKIAHDEKRGDIVRLAREMLDGKNSGRIVIGS